MHMAKKKMEDGQGSEDVCEDSSASASTTTSSSSSQSLSSSHEEEPNSKILIMRQRAGSYWTEQRAGSYWMEQHMKREYAKNMRLQRQQQQQNYYYHHQDACHNQELAMMMTKPAMYPPARGEYGYYPPQLQPLPLPPPPRRRNPNNEKWEMERYVALDCEMVGVGPHGKESVVARVALVAWNGGVIMDELVKQQHEVTDYRSFVSGITKEMLDSAKMDLPTVQWFVKRHLAGKILIGHGLENDLKALELYHPWTDIRDTATYKDYMREQYHHHRDPVTKESGVVSSLFVPKKLRDLAREQLGGRQIQIPGVPHSPVEDAIAALDLYKKVRKQWENQIIKNENHSTSTKGTYIRNNNNLVPHPVSHQSCG